jgi:hypothetical protein
MCITHKTCGYTDYLIRIIYFWQSVEWPLTSMGWMTGVRFLVKLEILCSSPNPDKFSLGVLYWVLQTIPRDGGGGRCITELMIKYRGKFRLHDWHTSTYFIRISLLYLSQTSLPWAMTFQRQCVDCHLHKSNNLPPNLYDVVREILGFMGTGGEISCRNWLFGQSKYRMWSHKTSIVVFLRRALLKNTPLQQLMIKLSTIIQQFLKGTWQQMNDQLKLCRAVAEAPI